MSLVRIAGSSTSGSQCRSIVTSARPGYTRQTNVASSRFSQREPGRGARGACQGGYGTAPENRKIRGQQTLVLRSPERTNAEA